MSISLLIVHSGEFTGRRLTLGIPTFLKVQNERRLYEDITKTIFYQLSDVSATSRSGLFVCLDVVRGGVK